MKFIAVIASLTASSTYAYVNTPAFASTASRQTSVSSSVRVPTIAKSILYATVETTAESGLDEDILSRITDATKESKQWAHDFDLESESGAAFHALFSGIRSSAALGPKGKPFYLKSKDVLKAMETEGNIDEDSTAFDGFFTFDDLAKALQDDFLDADRGSTDNRQGWKVSESYMISFGTIEGDLFVWRI
jgi:hypothetical protein